MPRVLGWCFKSMQGIRVLSRACRDLDVADRRFHPTFGIMMSLYLHFKNVSFEMQRVVSPNREPDQLFWAWISRWSLRKAKNASFKRRDSLLKMCWVASWHPGLSNAPLFNMNDQVLTKICQFWCSACVPRVLGWCFKSMQGSRVLSRACRD